MNFNHLDAKDYFSIQLWRFGFVHNCPHSQLKFADYSEWDHIGLGIYWKTV